jgi:uncharacterized membrane protein
MPCKLRPPAGRTASSQRGAVAIMGAIWFMVGMLMLMGLDVGNVFWQKRDLQRIADMSAMAGAQTVAGSGCAVAQAGATANAGLNGRRSTDVLAATCGSWNPRDVRGAVDATATPPRYFRLNDTVAPLNAVRVTMSRSVPYFFVFNAPGGGTTPSSRTVTAEATASAERGIASFSVGSRLLALQTNDSVLGRLLKGIGLPINGSLVAYDGLVNTKVTPSGLLQALGIPVAADISIGQFNALLAANTVSLGRLLDVVVTLAGRTDLISANASLLSSITPLVGVNASTLNVVLGSLSDPPSGLFAMINAPGSSPASALNIGVSAMDLVYGAIGVGATDHALQTGLNIDLLSLAKVTTRVAVIEPPSIAIGGVGAKAYTAQVRTYVRVKTDSGLLGTLLSPLVKLDLPILVDLVTGQGVLTDLCSPALQLAGGVQQARIDVSASILKVCVGQMADSDVFSKSSVCEDNLQAMEMVNVLGLLKSSTPLRLNGLSSGPYSLTLKEGETKSTPVNPLAIGTLVADLVGQLATQLFGGTISGTAPANSSTDIANQLWNDTASICTANTTACRKLRLEAAESRIDTTTAQSGLLTGVLNGLADLLGAVGGLVGGDGCSYTGLLGSTSNAGCVSLIKGTLDKSSQGSGRVVSNALVLLTGLVKPVLNAVGSSVLTPLLTNVLGIQLGQLDVNLRSLDCTAKPTLVY